jgi:predicted O-methyltransferase YrrM
MADPEGPDVMPLLIPEDLTGRGTPTHSISRAQARVLADLAAGKVILEIGAFLGGSTIVLASVARQVWSVDTHMLGQFTTSKALPPILGGGTGDPDTLARFRDNLKRYGVAERVVILVGYSADVLPLLRDGSFDAAFVDGGHDEANVRADAREALRLVRTGGPICFHDVEMPSVAAALADLPVARIEEALAVVLA